MAIRKGEREMFGAAVLASLLLHLVFMAALPGWHDLRRPSIPAPLSARLAPQAHPGVHVADAPEVSSEPRQFAASRQRPSAPRRSQAVREEPSPAVAPVESAQHDVVESAASQQAQEVDEPVMLEAAAQSRGDATSAPPAMSANAIGTLSQYRLAVMARARGFNRYPRAAIENDWQGRSELRVHIAADGGVESIDVRKSSGYAVLDREAIAMIAEAARRVPIPESLRGREFAIEIPVIFSLQTAAR